MTKKQNKMFPKKVDNFTFIARISALEGIIFDLKETLKYYTNKDLYFNEQNQYEAREILEKYNKSWDQLYDEIDRNIEKL